MPPSANGGPQSSQDGLSSWPPPRQGTRPPAPSLEQGRCRVQGGREQDRGPAHGPTATSEGTGRLQPATVGGCSSMSAGGTKLVRWRLGAACPAEDHLHLRWVKSGGSQGGFRVLGHPLLTSHSKVTAWS